MDVKLEGWEKQRGRDWRPSKCCADKRIIKVKCVDRITCEKVLNKSSG